VKIPQIKFIMGPKIKPIEANQSTALNNIMQIGDS
jgi:hypothetical protein